MSFAAAGGATDSHPGDHCLVRHERVTLNDRWPSAEESPRGSLSQRGTRASRDYEIRRCF